MFEKINGTNKNKYFLMRQKLNNNKKGKRTNMFIFVVRKYYIK